MGCGYGWEAMSVEEAVEMLEKAKVHHESMLKNINERLEKLKE